ncbi:ribosomal protein S18-alanine N-acetyltransferase [Psychrobacillus sp.]|uniref:ribosomal protein S18-alanine N-acetyltransferase n=1 Tax=Psychrobacillus sp. TaxID=1871623 RepID=UPI0028BD5D70|nr:ribosomal protein S18-alanine N-acetyltransferase [Psychrobacillus sp.]
MENNQLITYRKMTLEDIDQILLIEEEAFTVPWTREAFEHEMTTNLYSYYVIAETEQNEIIGYCGMWLVMDESHITNVAVAERMRGQKIGEGLMREAIRIVLEQKVVLMTLEVRVTNEVAKNLYYKLGFQDGGIRKNYYVDTGEDALVMWVEFK